MLAALGAARRERERAMDSWQERDRGAAGGAVLCVQHEELRGRLVGDAYSLRGDLVDQAEGMCRMICRAACAVACFCHACSPEIHLDRRR